MQRPAFLYLSLCLALAAVSAVAPSLAFAQTTEPADVTVQAQGWKLQSPEWAPGYRAIDQELEQNLEIPSAKIPFYHVRPAPKYQGVYLWDSAFIALIWKRKDPKIAKDIILSVLQNQQPDGRLPHVVTAWKTSPYTQPPVLSFSAAEIARDSNDAVFAERVYDGLRKSHEWMWTHRRLANGLFFWAHAYESGIDNSPRFGNRDESKFRDTTELAAIDLSTYMVVDAEAVKSLAELILVNGSSTSSRAQALRDDIALLTQRSQDLTALIQTKLWDSATGSFYDLNVKSGKLEKINTIASFFPLFAGIATREQFLALRLHLVNPLEFNTPVPLPSVARNSPLFEKDCWRGPVWINTAYLVIKGLDRYGDHALAQQLAKRLVSSVYATWENTGRIVEFYDPDRLDFTELTRKRGLGPFGLSSSSNPVEVVSHFIGKQIYLGSKPVAHFVGWTGLANVLADEEF